MRCTRIRKRLMAYHDGELTAAWSEKVKNHIISCGICQEELKRLKTADQGLVLPDPGTEYWDGFNERIMDRVKGATVFLPRRMKSKRPKGTIRYRRLAPALSLGLVVVVAAGLLMELRGPVLPRLERSSIPQKAIEGTPPAGHEVQSRLVQDETEPRSLERDQGRLSYSRSTRLDTVPAVRDAGRDDQAAFKPLSPVSKPAPHAGGLPAAVEAENLHADAANGIKKFTVPSGNVDESRTISGDLDGIVPGEKQAFSFDRTDHDDSYRSMIFRAEKLSREGRVEESEKVLREILSQTPPSPIQEEATILLVRVLRDQHRMGEARKLLTEAQTAWPENETVQGFQLDEVPAR